MPPKRPRATLQQKVQILDYLHQKKISQVACVQHYQDQVAISKSTINEWLKQEPQLRERLAAAPETTGKSRRKSKFKYEEINAKMDELVQENRNLTERELRHHWRRLAQQYGVEDPKRMEGFSHGWLEQFKKRHNLVKRRPSREAPKPVADERRFQPQKSLSFEPGNYNALGVNVDGQLDGHLDRRGLRGRDIRDMSGRDMGRDIRDMSGRDMEQSSGPGRRPPDLRKIRDSNPVGSEVLVGNDGLGNEAFGKGLVLGNLDNELRNGVLGNSLLRNEARNEAPRVSVSRNEEIDQDPGIADFGQEPSAHEIERFLFLRASRFFRRHHYDYPQTIKLFEEFKTSFLSEKIISLRAEDPAIMAGRADFRSETMHAYSRPDDRKLALKRLWEQNKNTF